MPKSKFRSLADHPLNYLILSAGCGCHDKTHVWSNFQKMKVWPIAVEHFLAMYHLIPANEWRHIPQILLDEIEKLNNKI